MNRLDVKYDFELDLDSKNSLKLINDRLKDNAKILEFGPANGRLTKHLNINRKCTVDIVEFNAISGKDAACFARKAFLGEEEGDIEKFIWADKLVGEKYDYIIFADVLEHLYNPEKVLDRCKNFLREDGAVLLSVPNIANNNIVLGLLEDEFNYAPIGLLDDTHIRFFTYKSIYKMADRLHYGVSNVDYTLGRIGETEVDVNIPKEKDISIVFEHQFGNVYQWIFELKLEEENKGHLKELPIKYIPHGCYITNNECVAGILHDSLSCDDDVYKVTFALQKNTIVNKFRFDPLEGIPCRVKVLEARTNVAKCESISSNAILEKDGVMHFLTKDPIIEFLINNKINWIYICYQILPLSVDVFIKELDIRSCQLGDMQVALDARNHQLSEMQIVLDTLNHQLNDIRTSRAWALMQKLWKIRDLVIPMNSRRRLLAKLMYKTVRSPRQMMDKITVDNVRLLCFWMRTRILYKPLTFPVFDELSVSIIIPAYNQFDYTYNCLCSILHNTENVSYEVIVADDVSTDHTKDIEKLISNITVLHNKQNLGFLRNCNEAAAKAKGKYILFLNNDTQVQPNWLLPLVKLLGEHADIGMTGSKLVYPDGRLQEAGGIFWRDGSAWNYGHGGDPDAPEFNYVKDVDYISGAAIMIRKELWEDIGGFDERFVPAYCEDADLAFAVRQKGYRVVYQPLSVVVHFEGVSNGRDLSKGVKRYQVENQQKFYEKWKHVLEEEHFPSGEEVFLARDRSRKKKTIVVIDHYVPHFDQDAGSRATFFYLSLFVKLGYHVLFVGDNYCAHQPYTQILQQMGIEVFYGADWNVNKLAEWLQTAGKYIDYVYLNRPHISIKYIDFFKERTKAKVIYFGVDLHFIREQRQYEIEKAPELVASIEHWKTIESSLFEKADVIYTPGTYEKKIVQDMYPNKTVRAIPIFLYKKEDFIKMKIADVSERNNLLFIGGFSHRPNVDAVKWFVSEIWPLVLQRKPKIKFYIIGSNPPQEILNLADDSIIVTGFVGERELETYYHSIRISIIPLRYGAGVKGKVLEAMFFGVPLVTTSIGAEGIPQIDEAVDVVPVKDISVFAERVLRLLDDDAYWRIQSQKERDYISRYFMEENAEEFIKKDFV